MAKKKTLYRAIVGLDYPPDRRVEAGELADDIPPVSLGWLLEQGLVEPVDEDEAEAGQTKEEPSSKEK